MHRVLVITAAILLSACGTTPIKDGLPGRGEDLGKVVVYRDTFGIPHIYAPTVEQGLYAMGRAQAEDRPEQLLINLKMALGEYASVVGAGAVNHDLTHRMFDHYSASQRTFDDQDEESRRHMLAYAKGVIDHYEQNPADVPEFWGDRKIDVHMFGAFGRYFLYNWSINEAYGDLRRAGIDPGFVPRRHASNQWTVSPSRTANGNAILLADPHLGWWGVTRFWEVRIHAGALTGSGVTLAGSPYIGLGHNENLAWAMTTGGPDTADIFELELDPENHNRYRYDDGWRELTTKVITLAVKGEPDEETTIYYSHHGPILAWAGLDTESPKAYAGRIAYDDEVNPRDLTSHLNFGKTWEAAAAGLASLGTFPQNVMVADTSGNIYFQRAGRVPVRAQGYDWSRPVDGSVSATAWRGFHPSSELVQILNPPQGYMQNCNIPPDAMIVNGPFKLDDYLPEIYSSAHYGPARSGWINQRAARALELLSQNDAVTVEAALEYAVDIKPYGIERWLKALELALAGVTSDEATSQAKTEVLAWNGELHRESAAAVKYAYFRFALAELLSNEQHKALRDKIDYWYLVVLNQTPPPVALTAADRTAIATAFVNGLENLRSHFGSLDVVYGDVFRVGRDEQSWPVDGGGSDQYGLTTLRTMGYGAPRDDHQRWGVSGQTSTQIIELSKPIKSWIYLPVGQSDRADSPHYTDQAEKVFSKRELKPSWWRPEELKGNIKTRTVYEGT